MQMGELYRHCRICSSAPNWTKSNYRAGDLSSSRNKKRNPGTPSAYAESLANGSLESDSQSLGAREGCRMHVQSPDLRGVAELHPSQIPALLWIHVIVTSLPPQSRGFSTHGLRYKQPFHTVSLFFLHFFIGYLHKGIKNKKNNNRCFRPRRPFCWTQIARTDRRRRA